MPKYFFIFFTLLTMGCSVSKFTIDKMPVITNKLKLNGCYFDFHSNSNITKEVGILFLYNNGVFYSENTYYQTLEKGLKYYQDKNNNEEYKKQYPKEKSSWGLYRILNDSIILEKPEPFHGYPIHKLMGKILNDTIFIITSYEENNVKVKIENGSYFYFKQFDNKPDSGNNFVK